MYLTPGELATLDFETATVPTWAVAPLSSEIRLSKSEYKTVSDKFISALQQSKSKLLASF